MEIDTEDLNWKKIVVILAVLAMIVWPVATILNIAL